MSAQDSKRILGFDFGLRRIGVAIGQSLTGTATPLQIIFAKQGIPNWAEIDKLIKEWHPAAIVVGWPVKMDGSEQPITEHVRQFISSMQRRCSCPIYEVDERLTSVAAREAIFADGGYKALKKNEIDSMAAKLIVESWLRSQDVG